MTSSLASTTSMCSIAGSASSADSAQPSPRPCSSTRPRACSNRSAWSSYSAGVSVITDTQPSGLRMWSAMYSPGGTTLVTSRSCSIAQRVLIFACSTVCTSYSEPRGRPRLRAEERGDLPGLLAIGEPGAHGHGESLGCRPCSARRSAPRRCCSASPRRRRRRKARGRGPAARAGGDVQRRREPAGPPPHPAPGDALPARATCAGGRASRAALPPVAAPLGDLQGPADRRVQDVHPQPVRRRAGRAVPARAGRPPRALDRRRGPGVGEGRAPRPRGRSSRTGSTRRRIARCCSTASSATSGCAGGGCG